MATSLYPSRQHHGGRIERQGVVDSGPPGTKATPAKEVGLRVAGFESKRDAKRLEVVN
jgi:hypothetical protein